MRWKVKFNQTKPVGGNQNSIFPGLEQMASLCWTGPILRSVWRVSFYFYDDLHISFLTYFIIFITRWLWWKHYGWLSIIHALDHIEAAIISDIQHQRVIIVLPALKKNLNLWCVDNSYCTSNLHIAQDYVKKSHHWSKPLINSTTYLLPGKSHMKIGNHNYFLSWREPWHKFEVKIQLSKKISRKHFWKMFETSWMWFSFEKWP